MAIKWACQGLLLNKLLVEVKELVLIVGMITFSAWAIIAPTSENPSLRKIYLLHFLYLYRDKLEVRVCLPHYRRMDEIEGFLR